MPVRELHRSSAIDRVAYNPASRELSIWFKGARRYLYSGVPARLYHELCDSDSAGAFVNRSIKGRYPCRQIPARRRYE